MLVIIIIDLLLLKPFDTLTSGLMLVTYLYLVFHHRRSKQAQDMTETCGETLFSTCTEMSVSRGVCVFLKSDA